MCPRPAAKIIVHYSNFSRQHEDKVFFETFYESVVTLVQLSLEIPHGLSFRALVEGDLGHIFRTAFFNTRGREQERPRLVDDLSIRDLYKLRWAPAPLCSPPSSPRGIDLPFAAAGTRRTRRP